jgi:DNA mismatch endonuclease (patch repair protein)
MRFRVDQALVGLPRRRADITFPRARVVVFVDGCFWHSCPLHATSPKSNASWWAYKLAANASRDRETDLHLRELGWRVLRFWEHEDPEQAADVVQAAVRSADDASRP